MPVRFAHFQSAEDAQVRALLTAACDRLQVAGGVERGWCQQSVRVGERREMVRGVRTFEFDPPHGVVQVLGEGDRWQPDLHRAGAGQFHRAHRLCIPGPFAVHMAVGR
jgi:hypothetical protein